MIKSRTEKYRSKGFSGGLNTLAKGNNWWEERSRTGKKPHKKTRTDHKLAELLEAML